MPNTKPIKLGNWKSRPKTSANETDISNQLQTIQQNHCKKQTQ
jgi:hypothetical protein